MSTLHSLHHHLQARQNHPSIMLPTISKSSSLLFGFLITFLALFVTFMGCGLGTRRALDLRRRRLAEEAAAEAVHDRWDGREPQIFDVWIERLFGGAGGRGEGKAVKESLGSWRSIVPLSTTLLPTQSISLSPPSPNSSPRIPHTNIPDTDMAIISHAIVQFSKRVRARVRTRITRLGSALRLRVRSPRHSHFNGESESGENGDKGGDEWESRQVLIAVLIAMPNEFSNPNSNSTPTTSESLAEKKKEICGVPEQEPQLGELALGVTDFTFRGLRR